MTLKIRKEVDSSNTFDWLTIDPEYLENSLGELFLLNIRKPYQPDLHRAQIFLEIIIYRVALDQS